MRRVLAAGVAFSFLFFSCAPDVALALPTGYTVESGTATFDTSTSNSLVISASDHAIINFDSFSIAQNESVRFIESSSTASVLGRVTGLSSSDIYGSLFSNGQLVLVNPNGFNFGATANVQVGSLIASTLDIQNAMYLKNDFVFQKIDGSNPGSIFNEGLITAADGGHIALLAESVTNKGSLVARLGSVVIGAGEKETLSFDQNGMVSLVVDQGLSTPPLKPAVENDGTISANGGKVLITAKTLSDTLDNLVNNTGVIEATRAVEKNGVIEFVSNGANVNSGTLNSNTLNESGYTFRSTGAIEGGSAFYDNLDGAATISGSIGSNQSDTGDLEVVGDITLTANNLSFTADSDNNGNGRFFMDAATQIDGGAGNNYNLTIKTGDHTAGGAGTTSALYGFVNMGTLTLSASAGSPTYIANSAMTGLGGMTIGANTTFNLNGQNFGFSAASSVTNNGTFELNGDEAFTNVNNLDTAEGTVKYIGDGNYTIKDFGAGTDYYNLTINLANSATESAKAGANLTIGGNFTSNDTYDAQTFATTVTGSTTISGASTSFTSGAGTQTFTGGLSFSGTTFSSGAGAVNTGDLSWSGSVSVGAGGAFIAGNYTEGASSLSGTINFTKSSGTQTASFSGLTYGDVTHSGAGTLQFTSGLNFSGTLTNSSGILDLNGHGLSGGGTISNMAVIQAIGSETMNNVTNDSDSGTWRFVGDNTGSLMTIPMFSIGGFPDDYYNVEINDTHASRDTFQLGEDLHVHGALTVTSGGFDMHTFGITVTGLTSINGANASFAADLGTQRFSGGLTISNGLFDGQLADLVIVGNLLLSGGTFKNPSLTSITVSGNLTNSGGTQDISAANPGDLSLNGGDQTVNGDWTFYTVTKSVTAAHTLTVKAGSTLRAENAMSLTGTAGNLLSLRSDTPGSQFKIKVDAGGLAGSTFDYLDVKDSNNLSPDGKILPTHSVNSGDTTNWFNAFTWTGGAGTNVFGTAGNWDVGAAPSSSTDDVDIVHVGGEPDPVFDGNYSMGSLSIAANGVLDLNGHNLTLTAFSNAGTLKLQGGETLTGFTNDTTQGTVQYTGAAAYASLAAGNNYYNVNFSGTGSWTLAAAMDANNNVTIGPTATLDTKNGSNYQINVGGNWSDSGTFTARAGTVVFDGTNQEILGNTTFSSLTKSVAATDTLTFEAGTTQTITGTATLKGASGQLLSLRSSAPTSAWDISPSGTRDIQYVDVQDSDNTSGTVISPANSQNSLRNVNWSFGGGGSSSASTPVVDTPYPIVITPAPVEPQTDSGTSDNGGSSGQSAETADASSGGKGFAADKADGGGNGQAQAGRGGAESFSDSKGSSNGSSNQSAPDEDIFAETYVSEGAVDVNGQLVYDGEKISIDGEGQTKFGLRALYVAIADGWIALRGKTYEPLKQVKNGERPVSLAASDDGETVYALYGKSRRLDRIKTGSFDATKLAALDDDMGDVALSPDGSILVSDASKDFIDVYAKDGRRLKTLSTGSMPSQMVITHDGRFCYVSDRLDGRVLKMDLKSGKEVASFEAGLSPYGLALLPDDSKLYITDTASAAVLVADTSKNKVTRTVPVERAPYAVEVGEGGRVFVTNRASDSVSVIDSRTDRVIATIPVGRRPTGLAMIPDNTKDGGKFLVANQLSGTVTVGSIRDLKALQNVPVGTAPTDVVLSTPRKD